MFCYYITHKVDLSLRRTRTQVNLDTRAAFAREGREQRRARRGEPSEVEEAGQGQ